ncbi:tripartite tricarboxylate transporter TctB family protein [Piscinibacter sakaiensis]|uniref:Tricarboxylate transport protein TctB n=1 Tax=Piscinibacter sakaiensis TaxID=1547922 RepID=A0A0K8NUK8_PISS1|nr:tripartite tricarboxylate transporter TctB family protein [Piscinibacter sakaiensis]GAP33630.1 tricarboxylate transport protein TctB [Piscinibacter sakaiensis]
MKIKSQRDFVAGLMFILVGIGFAFGATNYSMGNSARPGPGYFPLLLSVILAILGCVVLFKSLTIETEGGDPIGAIAWRPLLITVASIIVYGVLQPRLGLFIAVPVLIVMVSFAGDEFKWIGVLASAVVLTVFSWAVFVYGLNLTIPLWPTIFGQ